MKNTKSWMLIGAAALVVMVGAGAAYAHGGFGGRGGPGFMKAAMEKRIAAAEDLVKATPEQRKVIEGARDSIEAKMKAHFEAEHAAREAHKGQGPTDPHDLLRLLAADKIDEAQLYAEVDRRAEEMKAMARQIVPEIVKAHDALTPAQRQTLATKAEERRANMHERWEHHDQGGFGGPEQE